MRFLITGGAGFLGSHLTDALLQRGDEVTILDVASDLKVRHQTGNPRFRHVRDSILNKEILKALVSWSDVVYHLAAVVGVDHYVGDPYQVLNVNVNGTQNVLTAAFNAHKKVVFSSTSEVYGKSPAVPFTEDADRLLGSTKIDRWCYSTSKAVGEHFCFAFEKLGLPVVVLRYFNVYGPRLDQMDVGRVITIFLGQLMRGAPLTVIGDGQQTRCFTYIDDAIRATVAAGLKSEAVGHVINVGSDEEVTIKEVAEKMIRLSGLPSSVVLVPEAEVYGRGYEDIRRRVPDIRRMREILGVDPRVRLEEGLKRTLEWFSRERLNMERLGRRAPSD
jgi:UDP-glucose 4-epimerase